MKFGLIGAGCIGQLRAKALAQAEGCALSAITDVDPARARAMAPSSDVKIAQDVNAMLALADLDAVIVSTPPQFHEDIVISALKAGKHVLCEKPLANTVEACRRMVAASRASGRVLATGFNHRYFPQIQYLKQAIDSGLIGELDHVRAFAGHTGLSEFRNPWEYDKNVIGGGALMDVGIHIIDLTRYVLGEVEEVYGFTSNRVWNLGASEDNGIALLRNPQGKYAVLQATWTEWKGYRFFLEAYGTKGMVRAYYAPMMNLLITQDKPGGRRKRTVRLYPMTMLREKFTGWQSSVIRMFTQEFTDFLRLTRGEPSAIADGLAGYRAVEIANAVYRSHRDRSVIRLAEDI
ncbi:MAG: Gfo/Idh/MocA family oxidoreductase [Nitrospira sp.]|nr:Gfo/Idh/MocA family oxidoreductase [Nitrospira sp.]